MTPLARPARGNSRFLPLLALALAACSESGVTAPGPDGDPTRHPGFDTSLYPGDAAMRAWAGAGSPYEWTGYYLPAPCHRDTSWVGTRARLAAMGWGFAVIYVGQQDWSNALRVAPPADAPTAASAGSAATATGTANGAAGRDAALAAAVTCSSSLLGAAQGAAEAADAIARTAAEGFAPGTAIFLDLEPVKTIAEPYRAYYRAWVDAVLRDGRFRPGIYTHRSNAAAIYADVSAVHLAAGGAGTIPFWVSWASSTNGFALTSDPSSAFALATVWQGRLEARETWGGHAITIDANVATSRSPSE